MRGNPLGKRRELTQPVLLSFAIAFDIGPAIGIANYSTKRHEYQFHQRLVRAAINPRVFDKLKVFVSLGNKRTDHTAHPMQKRLLKRLPERGVPAQPPTAIIGPFENRRAIAVGISTLIALVFLELKLNKNGVVRAFKSSITTRALFGT